MNIKENILNISTLNEGIKWLKDSNKVIDIIHKIEKNVDLEEITEKQKRKIKILLNYLRKLYTKLNKLENEYKVAEDKESIKLKYNELKKDYNLMFKEYNINTFLNIVSIIGIGSLTYLLSYFALGALIPDDNARHNFFGKLGGNTLSVILTPLVVSMLDKNIISRTDSIISAAKKDIRRQER
jgi:hypothetical protein